MTSVASVTRQIAALDINGKKTASSSTNRPTHTKHPSQSNVTKLLTKFAAPNPFPNSIAKQPSALRHPTTAAASSSHHATTSTKSDPRSGIDIGTYDGGLEIENEKRGERVYGEAAEELALDSSTSKYASLSRYI